MPADETAKDGAMKIACGWDHRGYQLAGKLQHALRELGHEPVALGAASEESADYPDFAFRVGEAVARAECERGILLCGSGIGMCIAANKFSGVRAGTCHDDLTAEMSRRHNDLNVLCLSADLLGEKLIDRMVEIWLETPFESGRHARRVEKITALEQEANEP